MYILAPNKATSKFVKELPEELMKNTSDKTNSKVDSSRSLLKVKYSNMMQDALSKNQYDIVKEIAEILTIIDQHENGIILLTNSELQQQLKRDLKANSSPNLLSNRFVSECY